MVNIGGLDLFGLFVENIFGGVLVSIVGFAVLFYVLGMFTRMSPQLLLLSIGLFLMVMSIGFTGMLGVFIFGFIAFLLLLFSIIRLVGSGG